MMDEYTSSNNVEIQQRACEYLQLFDGQWDPHRLGIFEPMPFKGDENMLEDYRQRDIIGPDDDDETLDQSNKLTAPIEQNGTTNEAPAAAADLDDIFNMLEPSAPTNDQTPAPVQAQAASNLLDDIFGSGPPMGQSTDPAQQMAPVSSNPLDDIFGGGAPAQPQAPVQHPNAPVFNPPAMNPTPAFEPQADLFGMNAPAPAQTPQQVSMLAFEDSNIKIDFNLSKEGDNVHKITALYSNKTGGVVSDLNMQVSVKKYLKLELFSVSSSSLDPMAVNGSTQEMKITNSQEGSSPLVVRVRINYGVNGQPIQQTKVIDKFPSH